MSSRIELREYHTLEDLAFEYHAQKDAPTARHIHVVLLIKQGRTTQETANITMFSIESVYRICKRYNERGIEYLGDLRRNNKGKASTLSQSETELVKKNLRNALKMTAFGLVRNSQDG